MNKHIGFMRLRSGQFAIALFILLLPIKAKADPYFQQQVDYRIQVKLDDKNHFLHGHETIQYINNSGTELQCIYLHLWPNAYKDHKTALAQQQRENGDLSLYYASDEDRGYIDSLDPRVNGERVEFFRNDEHKDIGHILLNEPLKSGDTVIISTPFRVKIPKGSFSRMGHIGDSYKISQWFPKAALYDNNGWNTMPYLDIGEYFVDYGSYDVSITLPKNYTIGATGKLKGCPKESDRLEELDRATRKKNSFGKQNSFPQSSAEMKTLRFVAHDVLDFAWFADKRYHVMQEEVALPHSGRKVKARVLFTNKNAGLWKNAIHYLKDALYYYSLWVGDYPYDQATVVSGQLSTGGGMEYPQVTVIGSAGSPLALETTIAHEVGHNWFQAVLGTDERLHAWMDEGINSYYEHRYLKAKYPEIAPFEGLLPKEVLEIAGLDTLDHIQQHYLTYKFMASKGIDQPLDLPASKYTQTNYGAIVYSKGALLFNYLAKYLGQEEFDRIMKGYFEKWKFKHPGPKDLEDEFKNGTEKAIGPFFNDLLYTNKKIDYKLKKVIHNDKWRYGDSYELVVKNQGGVKAPIPYSVIQKDTVNTKRWLDGFKGQQKLKLPYFTGEVEEFGLDGGKVVPQVDRDDDFYDNKKLFSKWEPLEMKPFIGIETPETNQFYYSPIVGWNNYNRFMAGVLLHNNSVFPKTGDFAIAPLFDFHNTDIAGVGNIGWNTFFDDSPLFKHIRLEVGGQRFRYRDTKAIKGSYTKLEPALELHFSKKRARSPHSHKLFLTSHLIRRSVRATDHGKENLVFQPDPHRDEIFNELEYQWKKNDALLSYGANLRGIHHEDFVRVGLDLKGRFNYDEEKNGVTLRLFGGKFLWNNSNDPIYNFRMDGRTGSRDFLFDHYFFGRSETSGWMSQQFVPVEGGFKVPTAYGQSNDMIMAANLEVDIPLPFDRKIVLFYDHGFAQAGKETGFSGYFDAGVTIPVIKDILEFHLPLLYSESIEKELEINNKGFWDTFRFELRLKKIAPFKRIRTQGL